MIYRCHYGCELSVGMSESPPSACEQHNSPWTYTKALGSNGRKPLNRVSKRKQGEVRRSGSTLKRGRGFAASKAQQDKVKGLPCAVCGRDGHETQIHPAHVYPRRLASCECAEGVVPLCSEHHRQYDDQSLHLDLLPALVNRGYRVELVHAVVAHDAPIKELLEQVTGVRWEPITEVAA